MDLTPTVRVSFNRSLLTTNENAHRSHIVQTIIQPSVFISGGRCEDSIHSVKICSQVVLFLCRYILTVNESN